MPSDAIEQPPDSALVLCDAGDDCPVAWAFQRVEGKHDPHYHPRPHGPELPTAEPGPNYRCVICDEPGAILCEVHR